MSRKKLTQEETFPGLSGRIKKLRADRSQEEFGRAICISKPMVSKYESGSAIPSKETLKKIANHGGVTVEWLLRGDLPPGVIYEHAPETYEARPVELDVDALARIIAAARKHLQRRPEPLTIRQEARLIADLYYYWITEKNFPDDQVIKSYLPLAKREK